MQRKVNYESMKDKRIWKMLTTLQIRDKKNKGLKVFELLIENKKPQLLGWL